MKQFFVISGALNNNYHTSSYQVLECLSSLDMITTTATHVMTCHKPLVMILPLFVEDNVGPMATDII